MQSSSDRQLTDTISHETELAWAAGFFDGEGYVTIRLNKSYSSGPSYQLALGAAQNTVEPLERLRNCFGGGVTARNSYGNYVWQITTRKAEAALVAMLPYLCVKKEQALLGVAFQARRNPVGKGRADTSKQKTARLKQDAKDKERMETLNRAPKLAAAARRPKRLVVHAEFVD